MTMAGVSKLFLLYFPIYIPSASVLPSAEAPQPAQSRNRLGGLGDVRISAGTDIGQAKLPPEAKRGKSSVHVTAKPAVGAAISVLASSARMLASAGAILSCHTG